MSQLSEKELCAIKDLLSEEELLVFGESVRPMFLTMRNNSLENIRLASMRDSLLPRQFPTAPLWPSPPTILSK